MSRQCDRWCPFTACDSCPWKGGERLANGGLTCDNETVLADKRTAPAGALTPVDSGASPLDRSD